MLKPTVKVGEMDLMKDKWPSLSQVLDDEEIPHMVGVDLIVKLQVSKAHLLHPK